MGREGAEEFYVTYETGEECEGWGGARSSGMAEDGRKIEGKKIGMVKWHRNGSGTDRPGRERVGGVPLAAVEDAAGGDTLRCS